MDLQKLLQDCPIIAAVKDDTGLDRALCCDSQILFLLYGTICDIGELVDRVHTAGKLAFVHLDLIEGLAPRDVAVDFLCKTARPDGIITTKPALVRYAKTKGLCTVQRFFLLDSLAADSIERQLALSHPDMAELLPGLMCAAIGEVAAAHPDLPIIAGGLIRTKEEVCSVLAAGAAAVSSTNFAVWEM